MENETNNTPIDLSSFSTDNEILIISTLHQIKERGNLAHLEPVMDLIASTQSTQIKKIGLDIVKNIKSSEIKAPILYLMSHPKNENILREVVALCWEIKIDMGDSLEVFCQTLVSADLETAIEAYTVITENIDTVPEEKGQIYCDVLYKGLEKANDERKSLIVECIKIINQTK